MRRRLLLTIAVVAGAFAGVFGTAATAPAQAALCISIGELNLNDICIL